jgi:hypothetical protein
MKYEARKSATPIVPYHHGRTRSEVRQLFNANRPFIAWDGEGVNIWGAGKPQAYVLFGNSTGSSVVNRGGLTTWESLNHIIDTGRSTPDAIHCGFAFGYDANMIVQSLAPVTLQRLHKNGFVRLLHDGDEYVITYRKQKYFQVTRRLPGKRSRSARTTVRIYDIFTFFMCSFVKAYEDMIGPMPDELVQKGKDKRKDFTIEEFDFIEKYWTLEIELVRQLAEELRSRVYGAGLKITEWHGPGALASYSMKQQNIKQHMAVNNEEVRLASRYAYAAGRFELFKVGRVLGPVYGIDLNSAYPYGLTRVPSLSEGSWHYQDRQVSGSSTTIQQFGLYHLRLSRGSLLQSTPSPLFHRDRHHELSFPWHTEGWYWGPEAIHAVKRGAKVIEAWEYKGWSTRPFAYIGDAYEQRKRWKASGNSAQMALKLMMNAITGKAAQRVGWDEKTGRIPGWHQLEWAGYVTSFTRAGMFGLLSKIPFHKLISIETDGIYTTMSPEELGIEASNELGGWSVDEYTEAMYVQSGLAWLRKPNGEWETKRRGLDKDTFTLPQCQEYLSTLRANDDWPEYEGLTTRFTSIGQALASKDPKARHCVWVTDKRYVSTGRQGKRIHVAQKCDACKKGRNAYEQAHDLVISTQSIQDGKPASYPHSIPWEPEIGHAWWRDRMDEEENYV